MPSWVNRTVLSGASVAANGTASHTCTFTPAASGNFLIAMVAGGVTFTTPTGWTLVKSAINNAGLYVFSKTASASESSFSTTHNGSGWAIEGVVYEFYAGSTVFGTPNNATNQALNTAVTGPAIVGITGTQTGFAVRSLNTGTAASGTASCTWTTPSTKDYDAYTPGNGTTDGIELTIAYVDGFTASTLNPSSNLATTTGGVSSEAITFLLTVTTPPQGLAPLSWLKFG